MATAPKKTETESAKPAGAKAEYIVVTGQVVAGGPGEEKQIVDEGGKVMLTERAAASLLAKGIVRRPGSDIPAAPAAPPEGLEAVPTPAAGAQSPPPPPPAPPAPAPAK